MEVNRRDFMKVSGAGIVGLSLLQLGVDVKPVRAYARTLKIEGAKEVVSICPFCSVTPTRRSTNSRPAWLTCARRSS